MNATAVYELPVPIWVTCDVLGATYPSGCGPVQFDVVMPIDDGPVGVAPAVDGLDIPRLLDMRVDTHAGGPANAMGEAAGPGPLIAWTTSFASFIPESLRPATALIRIVVTGVRAKPHPTRSWAGPADRLVEAIGGWFNAVRTWVEVFTGQDLDPAHRVYDAEVLAPGLTFLEASHDGALAMTITTPSIRPVREPEWRTILQAVRDGKQPPLEELLSRDARAAHARGSYRRAIVDAATALEVVLSREVTSRAHDLPEPQRARLDRKPMLGTFIDIAETSGLEFSVAYDDLRKLSRARIDAVHRGLYTNSWDTANLVQIAIDFLGAHGTCRRSGAQEADGSEWVVVDD